MLRHIFFSFGRANAMCLSTHSNALPKWKEVPIVKERQLSPAQSSILFLSFLVSADTIMKRKMKKKMTVNRWLSFSLAIHQQMASLCSIAKDFSLIPANRIPNSWPGFSWHNDSECYRQEKIKEKVGQAVSVSRAYCGPHQEREKNGPQ